MREKRNYMAELRALMEERGDDGLLDNAVHDEKSAEATGINNEGVDFQIAYLRSNGWTDEMIFEAARNG